MDGLERKCISYYVLHLYWKAYLSQYTLNYVLGKGCTFEKGQVIAN